MHKLGVEGSSSPERMEKTAGEGKVGVKMSRLSLRTKGSKRKQQQGALDPGKVFPMDMSF